MKTSITLSRIAIGALLLAAAGMSARAQTVVPTTTFTLNGLSSESEQNGVTVSVGGQTITTDTGPYDATIQGIGTIPVFCIDTNHDIDYGNSYQAYTGQLVSNLASTTTVQNSAGQLYYQGGLASALTPADYNPSNLGTVGAQQRADEVAYLASQFMYASESTFSSDIAGASSNVNDNFAALTAALWNITQNGGGDASSTNGTSFYIVSGPSQSLIDSFETYASNWYNSAGSKSVSNVVWIQAPGSTLGDHQQEFLYVNPVPEPSVVITSLALVGMVGFGLVYGRRRANRKGA